MPDKQTFLQAVRHEIDGLKKNATQPELQRLDLTTFNPKSMVACIYGQMCEECNTLRAKELMDQCCEIVMGDYVIKYGGPDHAQDNFAFETILNKVNGEYSGQTWEDAFLMDPKKFHRTYKYMSALEGYVNIDGANIEGIIAYLKGETETLEL